MYCGYACACMHLLVFSMISFLSQNHTEFQDTLGILILRILRSVPFKDQTFWFSQGTEIQIRMFWKHLEIQYDVLVQSHAPQATVCSCLEFRQRTGTTEQGQQGSKLVNYMCMCYISSYRHSICNRGVGSELSNVGGCIRQVLPNWQCWILTAKQAVYMLYLNFTFWVNQTECKT